MYFIKTFIKGVNLMTNIPNQKTIDAINESRELLKMKQNKLRDIFLELEATPVDEEEVKAEMLKNTAQEIITEKEFKFDNP